VTRAGAACVLGAALLVAECGGEREVPEREFTRFKNAR
jgi:hypothetical protein